MEESKTHSRRSESTIDSKANWYYDILVAKELHYTDYVIDRLRKEPDGIKRQQILTAARHGYY
jgi:hypothetical protein